MAETVNVGSGAATTPQPGSAGAQTQLPGSAATVSAAAAATGGIGPGNLIESDIDEQIFKFRSEDTGLMSVMLKSKKVTVKSPVVEHYMIDEQRSILTTTSAVAASAANSFILPLASEDAKIPRDFHTLLVKGVDGYDEKGQNLTPGKCLMLFVTGRDPVTEAPIVRAVNGPKNKESDAFCTVPAIPANTKVVLLANALYETQKEVDPDLIIPQPSTIYLQKRGMNQVISDYFDAQKKHTPFTQALIAEQALMNFKRAGNRTLWAGRKGMFPVAVPKLGEQMVYFTEGIRWQFKRELQHSGKWTIEKLIALAKLYYTGEDVPKSCLWFCGKNLLEELQCIDYSKHPEIKISVETNTIGWKVTRIHTVFGSIDLKREPTLDVLGWSNSGALIGEDRLVHYQHTQQHEFNDRVDGEEATRKGVLVWDGLGLKGACHIWIDGEGDEANAGSIRYTIWDSEEAPEDDEVVDGQVYLLTVDCPGIHATAQNGQMWQAKVNGGTVTWVEYTGEITMAE
ncbi:MAG: hypothetical protein HDS77_06835 [Bacteroidales bacterium]|nr:hypothetical protein [Bacteroidales bacterium]